MVAAGALAAPERIERLLVLEDSGNRKVRDLAALARERRIPVQAVARKQLDRMLPRNQGLLAQVSAKGFASVETMLDGEGNPFLVLLDGVEDPQNLGAIIRSAEGAGAQGVILPARRAAGLTPAVYAASAGAAEHLPVAQVTNLARTMRRLQEAGVWIVGTSDDAPQSVFDAALDGPLALVLGATIVLGREHPSLETSRSLEAYEAYSRARRAWLRRRLMSVELPQNADHLDGGHGRH